MQIWNYYFRLPTEKEKIPKEIQPASKNKPPIGVIGPSKKVGNEWRDGVAKRYKEPEKNNIPIKKRTVLIKILKEEVYNDKRTLQNAMIVCVIW